MKGVLLIGPSKYALEGFDYSIMKEYQKIARINKYLETLNPGRCDIIFLNSNCVKFYLKKPHVLVGKKIYVKRQQESYLRPGLVTLSCKQCPPPIEQYPHPPLRSVTIDSACRPNSNPSSQIRPGTAAVVLRVSL